MFACGHCGKEFKYESEKRRHEISHNPQFECTECFKKFSFISALRRHQKQHTRTGIVQCSECNRNFRDESLLKRHIKYAHKETHICSKCEAKFNSQQALLSHQKTHKPKSERRYQCSYNGCDKTFNFAHHLKHHEQTHSAEKQHYCSSCGKGFIQLHHLKTHLKKHKPNSWLKCNLPECLKIFTNDYALKRHLVTHNKHNDLEQIYMEDEKETSELFKKYQLLEDLSFKKSRLIAEKIDDVPNLVTYSFGDSENLDISANKSVDATCKGCDCAKNKETLINENMPELKYNSDGTIKIKEFIDTDITMVKNVKKEYFEDKHDFSNFDIPYNSCKAVLGKCIVSGTGTISENCLCAKMAFDDSPMIYHEISELTPIPV
ncbi:zinc finger protein 37 homolog isoform X2 [Pieris rapae]|uniref:zinc finger protein 37 homolog isoform X2 n=1 Tax=Pieris rapae TaxID=64459 RepID=UPI001E280924|nr:zinc finger protein 37 homolog isoform X2 [Pieris rapae]